MNTREEKGPWFGNICHTDPFEHCPNAPTFEDRSQEETERKERCAHGDAWRLAKGVFKLKKTTTLLIIHLPNFFGVSQRHLKQNLMKDNFVVDSRASMYILSQKEFNSAELETNTRGSNSVCQRIGFIRDRQAPRRYTSSSLTKKTLRRSRIFL